jgi:hypothetical protein
MPKLERILVRRRWGPSTPPRSRPDSIAAAIAVLLIGLLCEIMQNEAALLLLWHLIDQDFHAIPVPVPLQRARAQLFRHIIGRIAP